LLPSGVADLSMPLGSVPRPTGAPVADGLAGAVAGEAAVYVNYCHECGRALSSARTERCDRCAWLRCECGACGCTYQGSGVRAVLATVPPVWGAVAPRHVASARPSSPRLRAAGPALVFATVAVLLALGLAAVTSWLAPAVAVAPEIERAAPVAEVPADPAPVAGHAGPPADGPPTTEAAAPAAAEAAPPAAAVAPALAATPAPAPVAVAPSQSAPAVEAVRPASAEAARPTASAVPAPVLPTVLYVGNTDLQGAFLRSQPRDGNDTRLVPWTDGTAMTPLETTTVQEPSGAAVWVRVRDPKGDTGWMRQAYLRPSR
jgi:hypothetical protein